MLGKECRAFLIGRPFNVVPKKMKTILTILLISAPYIMVIAGDVRITTTTKTNLAAKAWRRVDVVALDS